MNEPRPQRREDDPTRPAPAIPDAQIRALDRRHALDEQQRQFQARYPAPHFLRRRPPS